MPILNNSQAKAVFDAMCALNDVDGKIDVIFPSGENKYISVVELNISEIEQIDVYTCDHNGNYDGDLFETYESQYEFSEFYNL